MSIPPSYKVLFITIKTIGTISPDEFTAYEDAKAIIQQWLDKNRQYLGEIISSKPWGENSKRPPYTEFKIIFSTEQYIPFKKIKDSLVECVLEQFGYRFYAEVKIENTLRIAHQISEITEQQKMKVVNLSMQILNQGEHCMQVQKEYTADQNYLLFSMTDEQYSWFKLVSDS